MPTACDNTQDDPSPVDLAYDGDTPTPVDAFGYDRPAITDPNHPTDFTFVAAGTSTAARVRT